MLQFESDDYLELNDADLLAILRSRAPVSLTVASGRSFDLRGVLCQQLRSGQCVTHLAFYSPILKRSLVFQLAEGEPRAQLAAGEAYLGGFGFQLEEVQLDLKPAVREVVLRDIPALQKNESIRRLRKERAEKIADLEKTLKRLGKPAPSSKEGGERKRILEQLQTERQVEESLQTLREYLEEQLRSRDKDIEKLLASRAKVQTKPADKSEKPQVDQLESRQKLQKELEESVRLRQQLEQKVKEHSKSLPQSEAVAKPVPAAQERPAGRGEEKKPEPKEDKPRPQPEISEKRAEPERKPPVVEPERRVEDQLRADLQRREEKLGRLEQDLALEQKGKEQLAKELLQIKEQYLGVQRQLAVAEAQLETAEQALKASGTIEAQIEKLQKQLAKRSAELKSEQVDKKQLETELAAVGKRQAESEKALKQARVDEAALRKEQEATLSKLAAANKKLEESEQALTLARGDQAGKEAAFRKELAELKQDLAKARQALESARTKSEADTKELESLHKESKLAQKELAGLQVQLARNAEEIARFRKQSDDSNEKLKASEKERTEIEAKLNRLKQQNDEICKNLETAKREVARLADVDQQRGTLAGKLKEAELQVEQERQGRDSLARDASRIAARLKSVEQELQEARDALAAAGESREQAEQLQGELGKLRDRLDNQTRENAALVEDYAAARKQLAALGTGGEPALDAGRSSEPAPTSGQLTALQEQLAAAERQLLELAQQKEQLTTSLLTEQLKVKGLQQELDKAEPSPPEPVKAGKRDTPQKPPPHVARRPPLPGATFQVDWDLEALPCQATAVQQLWQSIYNVTLSMEGYPHQYVGALVVLLKQGQKDRLFVVLRLEKEGRNLVYRPVRAIRNDADLKKGLGEAQSFLRVSGIEVEPVDAGQLKKALQPYLEAG